MRYIKNLKTTIHNGSASKDDRGLIKPDKDKKIKERDFQRKNKISRFSAIRIGLVIKLQYYFPIK